MLLLMGASGGVLAAAAAGAGDGLDLGVGAVSKDVLEEDPERAREPGDVPALLQGVEPEDAVRLVSDSKLRRSRHALIQAELL
jgi:hypothetical protein